MFISYKPLRIDSTCNFNCMTCCCEKKPSEHITTEELKLRILSIPEDENVEFTGGEFFIRKDMETIINLAAERFSSVKYNTNGAVFAYSKVLERTIANGLNIVYLKFFSTNPEIHSTITRTDALKYVIEGFENLVEHQNKACKPFVDKWECGFFLAVNLFVHSLTLPTLEETAGYISEKKVPRMILNFSCSDCSSDEAILIARRCLEKSVENGTWAVIKGLPVCAMSGFEEHCGDVYRIDRFIPGNVFIPGICNKCVLYSTCGGVPTAIADKRKWTPITPESRRINIDDIIYFHSHIPAQVPSGLMGASQ